MVPKIEKKKIKPQSNLSFFSPCQHRQEEGGCCWPRGSVFPLQRKQKMSVDAYDNIEARLASS